MERFPVKSSNIASIGYDVQTQTLEIEFRNGSVYQYLHVPTERYVALMTADSKGGYFHRRIREAPYHFQRVWEED